MPFLRIACLLMCLLCPVLSFAADGPDWEKKGKDVMLLRIGAADAQFYDAEGMEDVRKENEAKHQGDSLHVEMRYRGLTAPEISNFIVITKSTKKYKNFKISALTTDGRKFPCQWVRSDRWTSWGLLCGDLKEDAYSTGTASSTYHAPVAAAYSGDSLLVPLPSGRQDVYFESNGRLARGKVENGFLHLPATGKNYALYAREQGTLKGYLRDKYDAIEDVLGDLKRQSFAEVPESALADDIEKSRSDIADVIEDLAKRMDKACGGALPESYEGTVARAPSSGALLERLGQLKAAMKNYGESVEAVTESLTAASKSMSVKKLREVTRNIALFEKERGAYVSSLNSFNDAKSAYEAACGAYGGQQVNRYTEWAEVGGRKVTIRCASPISRIEYKLTGLGGLKYALSSLKSSTASKAHTLMLPSKNFMEEYFKDAKLTIVTADCASIDVALPLEDVGGSVDIERTRQAVHLSFESPALPAPFDGESLGRGLEAAGLSYESGGKSHPLTNVASASVWPGGVLTPPKGFKIKGANTIPYPDCMNRNPSRAFRLVPENAIWVVATSVNQGTADSNNALPKIEGARWKDVEGMVAEITANEGVPVTLSLLTGQARGNDNVAAITHLSKKMTLGGAPLEETLGRRSDGDWGTRMVLSPSTVCAELDRQIKAAYPADTKVTVLLLAYPGFISTAAPLELQSGGEIKVLQIGVRTMGNLGELVVGGTELRKELNSVVKRVGR